MAPPLSLITMSAQKPTLSRVISDSWRVIGSNSLHFLALSSLFIFPSLVFNIINTLTSPHPSTPPVNPVSNYGRLFYPQDSEVPSMDKSQIISELLHSLPFHLFKICFVISTTNSVFHGFHKKPLSISSSLRSIIPSFFPLLATEIAYLVIMVVITSGFVFLMGSIFVGLALLGITIEPDSTRIMVVGVVTTAVIMVGFVYLEVELMLTEASVVMESKWGFSALGRSRRLVKGARSVAFWVTVSFWVLHAMQWALYSILLPSRSGAVSGIVVRPAVSTLISVLSLASQTVLFVYCKAFHGEAEPPTAEDEKLQGLVYINLPRDAEPLHF